MTFTLRYLRPLLCLLLAATLSVPALADNATTLDAQRFSPAEFIKHEEAFITRNASLTPKEAAAFFPLLHEKEAKDREIRKQMDALVRRSHNPNISESECRQILNQMAALDLQKTKLENSYHTKYRKVLSAKKTLRVIDACHRFDREIIKHMMRPEGQRQKRQQQPGRQ